MANQIEEMYAYKRIWTIFWILPYDERRIVIRLQYLKEFPSCDHMRTVLDNIP